MLWTKVSSILVLIVAAAGADFCGDPDANVTKSDLETWRCGLYVMNALGGAMKHVHTMKKLPGRASAARCARKGALSNPDEWDQLSEKCKKFMSHGLSGDFRLDKPLPPEAKKQSSEKRERSTGSSDSAPARTIGDELCNALIRKHICGYKYAFCLSTCGGAFMQTNHTGPEPICCKQVGRTDFRYVPCAKWRPFLEDRPVPKMCQDIVGHGNDENINE